MDHVQADTLSSKENAGNNPYVNHQSADIPCFFFATPQSGFLTRFVKKKSCVGTEFFNETCGGVEEMSDR